MSDWLEESLRYSPSMNLPLQEVLTAPLSQLVFVFKNKVRISDSKAHTRDHSVGEVKSESAAARLTDASDVAAPQLCEFNVTLTTLVVLEMFSDL